MDRLDQALAIVREVVEDVDPERVTGEEASLILERFVKLDRATAAGRLGFAARSAECMTWKEEGHRSAADWLAQKTKVSVGEAIATLETARHLPELEATAEALREGALSVAQVREIASAAAADPASEQYLIEAAGYLSLKGLQNRARIVKASSRDDAAKVANIHKERFFRHWLDPDGAFHLHARITPDSGANVISAVRSRALFVADEAVHAGIPGESRAAYEADALVALVTGDHRKDTFKGTSAGAAVMPS
jgi:hypothetical protein